MCGICKTNKSKHRVELIKDQISQFDFSSKGSKETLKLQHFGIGIDATWNLWSCFVASSRRGVDGLFNQNKLNCGQSVKWECERVRIMIGWLTEKYIHELTIALNEQSVTIEDYWRSHNSRVEFWHRRAEAGRRCVWLFFSLNIGHTIALVFHFVKLEISFGNYLVSLLNASRHPTRVSFHYWWDCWSTSQMMTTRFFLRSIFIISL